jgi:hypothetical protein
MGFVFRRRAVEALYFMLLPTVTKTISAGFEELKAEKPGMRR